MNLPDSPEQSTPEAVLSRVPLLKGRKFTIAPLEGVISLNNQSFEVISEGHRFLLRLASPNAHWLGIRRDDELSAAQAAADAGLSPRIHYAEPEGHLLMDFVSGRHWVPEDAQQPRNINRLGKTLRRLHDIRIPDMGGSIFHRIERLLESAALHHVPLPADFSRLLRALQEREAIAAQISAASGCGLNHNDLWLNNFLDDGENLWLLDWEFAAPGSGGYDLATVTLGCRFDEGQKRILLTAYGYPRDVLDEIDASMFEVHFFEGAWALAQHGLRGSQSFDFLGYAHSRFAKLQSEEGTAPI